MALLVAGLGRTSFGQISSQQWSNASGSPVLPVVGLITSGYGGFGAEGGLTVGVGEMLLVIGVYGSGEVATSAKAFRVGAGMGGLAVLRAGAIWVAEDEYGGDRWQVGPELAAGMMLLVGRVGYLAPSGSLPGKFFVGFGLGI